MLTIIDGESLSRALATSNDPRLKQLVRHRGRQLDVEDLSTAACFVIVQPGDTMATLDQVLSFSVLQNPGDGTWFGDPDFTPGWEWIEDHGFAWELVFIFTDDGFAHVVIVENAPGIDADLLNLCTAYTVAVAAD